MPVTIEAVPEDWRALSTIEAQIFDYDIISPRQMKYLIASPAALVIKAVVDKEIEGYLVLLTRKNSHFARLYSLGVLPGARSKGIGKQLLQYGEEQIRKRGLAGVTLEQKADNERALAFYLNSGYSLHGQRQHYYTDGSDALLLKNNFPQIDLR